MNGSDLCLTVLPGYSADFAERLVKHLNRQTQSVCNLALGKAGAERQSTGSVFLGSTPAQR